MACDKTRLTQRQSAWNLLAENADTAQIWLNTSFQKATMLYRNAHPTVGQTQKHLGTVHCVCILCRCCKLVILHLQAPCLRCSFRHCTCATHCQAAVVTSCIQLWLVVPCLANPARGQHPCPLHPPARPTKPPAQGSSPTCPAWPLLGLGLGQDS